MFCGFRICPNRDNYDLPPRESVGSRLLCSLVLIPIQPRSKCNEPSPVERLAHEAARLHRLHEHEDLEVRHVLDVIVLGLEEILLRHENALLEEV